MPGFAGGSGVCLSRQPVDFRRGISALSVYAREHLGVDPASGGVRVFRSRRSDRGDLALAAGIGGCFASFAGRAFGAVRCLRRVGCYAGSAPGAWFWNLRLATLGGSNRALPDESENRSHLGLAGSSRGSADIAKLRSKVRMEVRTRAPFAWCGGPLRETKMEHAERRVPRPEPGVRLPADGCYCGFPLWSQAVASGAELLWRVKSNLRFPAPARFSDGSWRSVLAGSEMNRRASRGDRPGRALTYRLAGIEEGFSRATTLPDVSETRRPNSPRTITSAGKSRPPMTKSRRTCPAPKRGCAAKCPTSCYRNSTA